MSAKDSVTATVTVTSTEDENPPSTSTGAGFLLREQNENASSTGFLLREFAKVVAVEERDLSNSTDKLIQAADEVRMFAYSQK
jgi:hypothetical protein